MTTSPYATYKQVAARTVTRQDEILLRLYTGVIQAVRCARQHLAERNIAAKGEQISKAIAIIGEFDCALDHDIGGEMAVNLSRLYQYMLARLTQANIHNDPAGLDEVETLLCELKEAFEMVIRQAHDEPMQGAEHEETANTKRVNIVT